MFFRRAKMFKRTVPVLVALVLLLTGIGYMAETEAETDEDEIERSESITNVEIYSNRHTMPDPQPRENEPLLDLEGYVKKLENEKLEIWYREAVQGMRIRVKETGYVWGSMSEDKPAGLNDRWAKFSNAIMTFEYFDSTASDRTMSLSDESLNVDMSWTDSGFVCDVYAPSVGFNINFVMTLYDDHISFEIPKLPTEEIEEFKLKSVYFMPFLGTTYKDEVTGYMFVPDGPGALIRYNTPQKYVSNFEKKVYGKDLGIDSLVNVVDLNSMRPNDYLVEEPQISIPVFGMAHTSMQNAFFSVIEKSEEYATILGEVSGTKLDYNWACARFDYRQRYMQPINKRGTGILMPKEVINDMTPKISFYFLTGDEADYAGMAKLYRSILIEDGTLTPSSGSANSVIPLRVDLLAADVEEGFLWNPVKTFTTTRQGEDIVNTLYEKGINNLTLIYKAWRSGGENGGSFNRTGAEGKIGGVGGLRDLRDLVTGAGGSFFLDANIASGNVDQVSLMGQAATTLSKSYIFFSRDSGLMYNEKYFVRPGTVSKLASNLIEKYDDFDFSFDQYGSRLYADYTRNNELTRAEAKEIFAGIDAEAVNVPNLYLWGNTDVYLDIPMVNSQYLYETDTVPFLQMVLKGSMEYYAPYSNMGFYSANSILKMIEYGAYPSFILVAEENRELKDTPQEELFSVNFNDWMPTVEQMYGEINKALAPVEGLSIIDHVALDYGISVTVYEDMQRIYVNYTDKDYVEPATGAEVKAHSYALWKGGVK